MSRDWEKVAYAPPWAGLADRRQTLGYGPQVASIAKNVDFYGGAVGKRPGTQFLNGWGAICEAGWDTDSGTVDDESGFTATDQVTVYLAGGLQVRTISSIVAGVITLSVPLPSAPPAGTVIVLENGTNSRIGGLFHAHFRDGTKELLAWQDGAVHVMPSAAGGTHTTPNAAYPSTTVLVTWPASSTTTGQLASVEGLEVGDKIFIVSRMGSLKYATIETITPSTRTIVLSGSGVDSNPETGDTVIFVDANSDDADAHFVQYNNATYFVTDESVLGNGSAGDRVPRKYSELASGYKMQRMGIKPPVNGHNGTSQPSATAIAGTGLSEGDYSYRVKFLNQLTGQESEPSPELTATTSTVPDPDKLKVQLDELPISLDEQVTHKRLYRSLVLPSGESAGAWYFHSELTNATLQVFDVTPDVDLGVQMREFVDYPPPDGLSQIALWPQANRLIGVDQENNLVVFSDQFDLEYGVLKGEAWPLDNFILVSYDDGDPIRCVAAFYDSVIIFKERSTFRLTGIPPNLTIEPVIFRQDLTGIGTFNAKAVVVDQNEMLFPGEDGVNILSRWEGDQKGFTSRRLSRELDNGWDDLNYSQRKRAHGVFFREKRQYRLVVPVDSDTEPRRMYVFQFEGSVTGDPYGWSEWDLQAGDVVNIDITASCVVSGEPDVHYIATATGDVIRMDYGAADRGGWPIEFIYSPAWIAPSGQGTPSRGRAIDLAVGIEDDTTFTVSVEQDFEDDAYPVTLAAVVGSGKTLVTAHMQPGQAAVVLTEAEAFTMLRALGEYHRLRFVESSATARFLIQNWTYWYQTLPIQAKRRAFIQDRG